MAQCLSYNSVISAQHHEVYLVHNWFRASTLWKKGANPCQNEKGSPPREHPLNKEDTPKQGGTLVKIKTERPPREHPPT